MGKLEKIPSREVRDVIIRSAQGDPEAMRKHEEMSRAGGKAAAKARAEKADRADKEAAAIDELHQYHLDKGLPDPRRSQISAEGDVLPPESNQ